MTTPLYDRYIAHHHNDPEGLALSHKVWDPTPWMINVYVGRPSLGDEENHRQDMGEFCSKHFGRESWPIHDKPGKWMFGGATVDGWTWIGFASQEMMDQFLAAFPQGECP